MLYKVPSHLVKAFAGGDDVVVAFEFSLQPLLNVDVVGFQFLQFLGDPLVEVTNETRNLSPRAS